MTKPNNNKSLKELDEFRSQSRLGGGKRRIEQQHSKGKLTARERINLLFDNGSFREIDSFMTSYPDNQQAPSTPLGDAVVTGYGNVCGRLIFAFSQDFTIMGGSVSDTVGKKICKIIDLAMKTGAPIVGLNDSGGARIQEGVLSLAAYGEIFFRNTQASGLIPQISVILGPSAGGAVYSPAITDFIFMVRNVAQMYITGPDVIKAVIGEEVTHEELGGARTHNTKSGVSHFVVETEEECFSEVRRLLSFLPSNNTEDPVITDLSELKSQSNPNLLDIVPHESSKTYDIHDVLLNIIDDQDFMEIQKDYAQNIVIGFGRLAGRSVGFVGNQPMHLAGVLDINASVKAARFVRFCDAFNIPIITFIDVPGFLPGTDQEYGGIIRHGAKLIYAYAEATVPKVSVLLRKAYGGAYIVMSSKHLRGDINLSWPSAEIAVMGPDSAVDIIHKEKIADSKKPKQTREKLIENYKNTHSSPYVAAGHGFLDDVINPDETREYLINSINMLQNKRANLPPKKHGNIPL